MAEDRYNASELIHLVMNDEPIEPRCSNCVHWVGQKCTAQDMVPTQETLDYGRIQVGAEFPPTKAYDRCAKFVFIVTLDTNQSKAFCEHFDLGMALSNQARRDATDSRWRISTYASGTMEFVRDNQLTREVIKIHDGRAIVVYKQTVHQA